MKKATIRSLRNYFPQVAQWIEQGGHSLRFQAWRHAANSREGIAPADAQAAMNQFKKDLATRLAVFGESKRCEPVWS